MFTAIGLLLLLILGFNSSSVFGLSALVSISVALILIISTCVYTFKPQLTLAKLMASFNHLDRNKRIRWHSIREDDRAEYWLKLRHVPWLIVVTYQPNTFASDIIWDTESNAPFEFLVARRSDDVQTLPLYTPGTPRTTAAELRRGSAASSAFGLTGRGRGVGAVGVSPTTPTRPPEYER
ncbi:hypothetical protein DFJ73DRAFT_848531 [Zopfochytrium polystomum]|nr:hypothetical protein DFJ73DRAFT_848531 [Zopfochytrium polystomum]